MYLGLAAYYHRVQDYDSPIYKLLKVRFADAHWALIIDFASGEKRIQAPELIEGSAEQLALYQFAGSDDPEKLSNE